jgi:hypothetical protein
MLFQKRIFYNYHFVTTKKINAALYRSKSPFIVRNSIFFVNQGDIESIRGKEFCCFGRHGLTANIRSREGTRLPIRKFVPVLFLKSIQSSFSVQIEYLCLFWNERILSTHFFHIES